MNFDVTSLNLNQDVKIVILKTELLHYATLPTLVVRSKSRAKNKEMTRAWSGGNLHVHFKTVYIVTKVTWPMPRIAHF